VVEYLRVFGHVGFFFGLIDAVRAPKE